MPSRLCDSANQISYRTYTRTSLLLTPGSVDDAIATREAGTPISVIDLSTSRAWVCASRWVECFGETATTLKEALGFVCSALLNAS